MNALAPTPAPVAVAESFNWNTFWQRVFAALLTGLTAGASAFVANLAAK